MTPKVLLPPGAAEFPTSNFPQYTKVNDRPVLAFDASTDESCYWTFVAPSFTGTPKLYVYMMMASATSGDIYFQAAVEAVTSGDSTDLDATTGFDTANTQGETALSTAGYMRIIAITLTNNDSMAAEDLVRIKLNRDADNASDTATGDCYVLMCALMDT